MIECVWNIGKIIIYKKHTIRSRLSEAVAEVLVERYLVPIT